VSGRRKGKRCAAVTRANRRARKCSRRILLRKLSRSVAAGPVKVDIGRLRRGVYVIAVAATSNASVSTRVR
jgi:hypothetical protein